MHSSFREGGSWTILEAMAHGVPVICQDRAGMKDMVRDACGTKVAASMPEGLVDGLKDALIEYYQDPVTIQNRGRAGQENVCSTYSWAKCGDEINRLFALVSSVG